MLAGCGVCHGVVGDELEISDDTRVEPTDRGWVVDGRFEAKFFRVDAIHEVAILVRDPADEVVDRHFVGELSPGEGMANQCGVATIEREFELTAGDAYPYRITVEMADMDLQCEGRTRFTLREFVFDEEQYDIGHAGEVEQYWRKREVPCPDRKRMVEGPGTGTIVTEK